MTKRRKEQKGRGGKDVYVGKEELKKNRKRREKRGCDMEV